MGNNPAVRHAFESPQSRGHAEAIFREFDKDKNGRLDKREYAAFLDAYWSYLVKSNPEMRNTDKATALPLLMPHDDCSVDFFEFWRRLQAHAEGAALSNEPTLRCHACTGVSAIPASVPNGAFLKCPFCDSLNTISRIGSAADSTPPPHVPVGRPVSPSQFQSQARALVAQPVHSPMRAPVVSPVNHAFHLPHLNLQSPSHHQAVGSPSQSPVVIPAPSPVYHSPLQAQPLMISPVHQLPIGQPMGSPMHFQAVPSSYHQSEYPVLVAAPSPRQSNAAPATPARCLTPGCEFFGNASNLGHCNKCGSAAKKLSPLSGQSGLPIQSPMVYVSSPSTPIEVCSTPQFASPQQQFAPIQGPQTYAPSSQMNQGPQAFVPPQQLAQNPQYAEPGSSERLSRAQVAEEIFRLLDANGDDSIHPREAGFLAELFEHINLKAAEGLLRELRTAERFGNEEKKSLSRLEMLTKINSLPEPAMREIYQKLHALDAKFRTELLTALFEEWDSDHNHKMDENEAQLFGVIAQTKIIELFKGRDPELANRLEARVSLFQQEVAKCRNMGGITPERFVRFWLAWSLVHLYAVFHEVLPSKVMQSMERNPFGSFAKHQVEFALEHSKKAAFQTTGLYLLFEKGDGNCLFRSVARLVKGDPEAHFVTVRLESARLMQSQKELHPGDGYVADIWGFPTYTHFVEARLDRRRWERGCVGNRKDWGFDPDLQAISLLYQRPVHIYHSSHLPGKRGPDTVVYPVGSPRARFEATRPISLFYTGAHYQSLVPDPDFTTPLGPGPDPLSPIQARTLEDSMRQMQIQASMPDWTCDFCMQSNHGSSEACARCHIKIRR